MASRKEYEIDDNGVRRSGCLHLANPDEFLKSPVQLEMAREAGSIFNNL